MRRTVTAQLNKNFSTASQYSKRSNRSRIVAGKSDEDDEIDGHKSDNQNFEKEKNRIFTVVFESIKSLAVKLYDGIYPKNEQNTRLNCHLSRIDLTIEGSETKEDPSRQIQQPVPHRTRLYGI